MNNSKLSNNIRALRIAYGETLEKVGEYLNIGKTTVANYESGIREPSQEILALFASHFGVSIELLLHGDFSGIDKVKIDKSVFWKKIDIVFPIVSSEKSLEDAHFSKAYKMHQKLYDSIKHEKTVDFDELDKCLDEYLEIDDTSSCIDEAAVNILSCWLLMNVLVKLSSILPHSKSAAIMQVANDDPSFKKTLDDLDSDFEVDAKNISDTLASPEVEEFLNELIKLVKNSNKWSDLAYYYLALLYVYGIKNNNIVFETSQMIGFEMMDALISVENVYASQFLKLNFEAIGQGSRFVNTKQ